MRKLKKKIIKFIRYVLRIRDNETICDGLNRKYYFLKKTFPHKNINQDELKNMIDTLKIQKGDVLIVHSSWRALYMLDSSPLDVLKMLFDKVGEDGTIIMPCYGYDKKKFHVLEDISAAGVLSECLRNYEGASRSVFPKFSMCGYGKNAEKILSSHYLSRYQFDENSPYYIATQNYYAKVLLLGMGYMSHKISVFHCACYQASKKISFYKQCYGCINEAVVVDKNGVCKTMKYVDRKHNYVNDKGKFKSLIKKVDHEYINKSGAKMLLFSAKEAYDVALDFCLKGGRLYKRIF